MMIRWIAAMLSALLPGAGQFLNHDWAKGGAFLIVAMIASGMLRRGSFLSSEFSDGSILRVALFAVLLGLAAWSAADAYRHSAQAAH